MAPLAPHEPPDPPARRSRARWWLLGLYIAAYGGFIAVTVLAPRLLSLQVIAGVNLAVAWGMGLIALAFVVALLALRLREDG